MRICFIYTDDIRQRSANPLSMLKNIAASRRLGHEPVLLIPRKGMSFDEASRHLNDALHDSAISERFPLVQISKLPIKGLRRRSFASFAAIWVKTQAFDLVWSRNIYVADFVSALGLPTIVEHHTLLSPRRLIDVKRMSKRRSFRAFVAISDAHKCILEQQGVPGERIVTAHSGVDIRQFSANVAPDSSLRIKLGLQDQPIVLYAGSLYPGRGIELLLDVAAKLTEIQFLCIGGRNFEVAKFHDQVKILGLRNIHFLGYVPNVELPKYLLAANVLIAPYTEESQSIGGDVIIAYSSPIKLFEYMAAGKPIITSNIGAIPEVMRDGHNGLLVTPGNVDELAHAIIRILSDPLLAKRLGATARKDVIQYTWENRVSRILEFVGIGQDNDRRLIE